MPQLRNTLLAAATVLALAIPQFGAAQDYPSRPVRVVVAFPPGGPTDFVGRLITDKMSALLGQRLYIENRAGADGTVGADKRRQIRSRRLFAVSDDRRRRCHVAPHHGEHPI